MSRSHKHRATISLIKRATPPHHQSLILALLLENEGMYISVDGNGGVSKYHTFDQYIDRPT